MRSATRAEKKRKAMAMRDKQLKAFGMTVNEKGQVIASSKHLQEMEKDLADEPGLKCCICLEGYNNHPKKVSNLSYIAVVIGAIVFIVGFGSVYLQQKGDIR